MQIRAANPTDAGLMAKVHVDTWKTTYAGIVPAEYLSGLSYQEREKMWVNILETDRPSQSNFVAETDEGEIIGFASSGPEREGDQIYKRELYAIYVFQQHQNQGVGRHLVSTVAQQMLVDGIQSMLVWVLKDNHTGSRFYESLGGKKVGRKTIEIGGIELVEVSYGWKNIAELVMDRKA